MAIETKSAALATVLSLIFPGIGQLYTGRIGKGIALIIASIISIALFLAFIGFVMYFFIWIYGMIDAYNGANRINAMAGSTVKC